MPEGLPFSVVDRRMKKKAIGVLINTSYLRLGLKDTVIFADQVMYTGFHYAMKSGVSIGIDDLVIPPVKAEIIESAEAEVTEINQQFQSGLVTAGEKYNKVIDIWSRVNENLSREMMANLSKDTVINAKGEEEEQSSFNSVFMMADSGARGSAAQIRQLAGRRGLMARTTVPTL